MKIPVEVQLLRDMEPRTRPSPGLMSLGENTESHIIAYPGAASNGAERIVVTLRNARRITLAWATLQATFSIEGLTFCDFRPLYVFLGITDIWSGICYFPVMSGAGNRTFSGLHSLCIRAIDKEGIFNV